MATRQNNPADSDNRDPPLSKTNERMESLAPKNLSQPPKEKRVRTWSFDSAKQMEEAKKTKVHDTEHHDGKVASPAQKRKDQPPSSPVFVANGWPQRSPIKTGNRGGSEHICQVQETHTSSPSSGEQQKEQEHEHEKHPLFNESFETISNCESAMDVVPEQTSENDGLLSPRQKTHTPPTGENEILSPNHERNNNDASNVERPYNTSPETREGKENLKRGNSPHSPPQRFVHVAGDENGCGNVSPIKFSPPTDPSPPLHGDHRSPQYDGDHQYCQFVSTSTSERNEDQKAAEVSFDNSAGYQSYRQEGQRDGRAKEKSASPLVPRSQKGKDDGRDRSYSASTLSDAKTPPRRGTSRSQPAKEARSTDRTYESIYTMPPQIPREFSHPHFGPSYYPHHPPVFSVGNLPPDAASFHRDPSRVYQQAGSAPLVRNDRSGRMGYSTPIRPSRASCRTPNARQDPNHLYREPTPSEVQPHYNAGHWMAHNYPPESREYPPPRAHLPTQSNNHHWNPHHHSRQQYHGHHGRHPPTLPTQEIPTQGHAKGRRGTPPLPSAATSRSHQQHSPPAPQNYYPHPPMSSSAVVPGESPDYESFILFRSIRKIFQGFSYLLYPAHMGMPMQGRQHPIHTDPEDLKVARRRVESAICALGGYIKDIHEREESPNTSPSSSGLSHPMPHSNVFRRRTDFSFKSDSSIYRDRFHHRYFVGDHGVSWDVEENPPVFVSLDEEDNIQNRNAAGSRNSGNAREGMQKGSRISNIPKQEEKDRKQPQQHAYNTDPFIMSQPSSSQGASIPVNHLNQKMKYRCKLCGQPKQNHICPYRKSLVRTLGIMVCPAVNAYNSAEPGVLTPPLSQMNNFVPYGRSDEISDLDTDVSSREHNSSSSYNVTPGGSRKQNDQFRRSPASSSLSTSPHSDAQESRYNAYQQQRQIGGHRMATNLWEKQKSHSDYHRHQPLFMTLALRPEHYRAVTPRKPYRNGTSSGKMVDERDDREERGSFKYPHVPLTFLGRKRLTDTLFLLSRSLPPISSDVASLLRMARENDEWDLAVAELLTQLVVCIHCSEGDYRLDGLKNYLLKIGIAS